MENEFIPFDECIALQDLGFDEECFGHFQKQDKTLVIYYSNLELDKEQKKRPGLFAQRTRSSELPQWAVAAPLYQQAFRFFRDKYNLFHEIIPKKCYPDNAITGEFYMELYDQFGNEIGCDDGVRGYDESELACLRILINETATTNRKKNERK